MSHVHIVTVSLKSQKLIVPYFATESTRGVVSKSILTHQRRHVMLWLLQN